MHTHTYAHTHRHTHTCTGALSMRTTGHGEVELQPAFLLFLPPRRRGIRSLLIMRHPALHASDTHVATRRWILQMSFGTHCYVAQQQGTSYPSQVPSLEGGVGISARARTHTHTHAHTHNHTHTHTTTNTNTNTNIHTHARARARARTHTHKHTHTTHTQTHVCACACEHIL